MLIDILEKIFHDNHFMKLNVEFDSGEYQYFLSKPNSEKTRQEYFLVLEKKNTTPDDISVLIEKGADDFFEKIRKSDQVDEAFEKNCTIIFCYNSSEKVVNPEILLRLEEDPYNFKKNVIEYNVEELERWKEISPSSLSVENLNVRLGNGEAFTLFKEGAIRDSYSLLMKIAIKLPFINFIPQAGSNLYDLTEEIRRKLSEDELNYYDFVTQQLDLQKSEEQIEKLLLSEWKVENE